MEDRELLKLAWDWALRQHELLKTIAANPLEAVQIAKTSRVALVKNEKGGDQVSFL
jgi:hypothetical protein